MKITLFIDGVYGGGAQRQMSIMARLFQKHGHKVTLVTFTDTLDDYDIPLSVERIRLASGAGRIKRWLSPFSYFYFLRTDVVITFIANQFAILPNCFKLKRKYKIIAGERTFSLDPAFLKYLKKMLSFYYIIFYIMN